MKKNGKNSSDDNKGKILYSSDGSGVNLAKAESNKPKIYLPLVEKETVLKLRIEKNGRGGKTVSVIYNLPDHPPYFKELLKKLKNLCATGGALKESELEIQGDHLEKIRNYLKNLGFQVKG